MPQRKIEMDHPDISNTRQGVVDNTKTNFRAVVDSLIMGGPSYNDATNGWVFSQSGGTAELPQYHIWTNQANTQEKLRATYARTGNFVDTITWEYSDNAGSSWTSPALRTVTIQRDGSNNMTGGNNSSLMSYLFEWVGKFLDLRSSATSHIGLSGASVHGLGTISTQSSAGLSVTGGNIDGTTIGATTPAAALFTRATEQRGVYTPGSGAGVTLSWAYGGSFVQNSGTNVLTFSGIAGDTPVARVPTHLLYVTNLNSTTFPAAVAWGPSGKPSVAGGALISMVTMDIGATVWATLVWKAV